MDRNPTLFAWIAALALLAPACSRDAKDPSAPGANSGEDGGAGPGGDPHEDGERALGTVSAGGTSLAVAIAGEVAPGAELHVELDVTEGATPVAVRLWAGQESGVGSLRAKADADGAHFHAHVEIPSDVSKDARLWIEVEAADGKRRAESLAFPKSGS